MWKLAIILFIIVGPTFAGIGALVPLTLYGVGDFNALYLIGAAAAGAVIAVPASVFLGKRINDLITPKGGVAA